MVKSEKYIVGTEKDDVYKSLFKMIPKDDKYMHLRLSGALNNICTDIYFLTHVIIFYSNFFKNQNFID